MTRHLQNISLLAASFLFVELLLRLFDPIGIGHFAAQRQYHKRLVFGEAYGYIHQPSWRARIQGVDVVINQYGLRSPPTTTAKPTGTKRLLILGDSVVHGWGAPQDSIFPARLQRAFAGRSPPVEVIAAGIASWNTRTEYEWLRTRGLAFAPDVLLLLVVGNDADPIYVGHTDVPHDSLLGPATLGRVVRAELRGVWQFGYQRSRVLACAQFARVFVRQRKIESAGYPPESPQWRDARLALDGIIDLCAKNGVALVVFLYGDETLVAASGVLRAYRGHLLARGIRAHTLPSALFAERRYRNSVVDGHENAAGHAVLANAIRPVVEPLLTGGE